MVEWLERLVMGQKVACSNSGLTGNPKFGIPSSN